MHPSFNLQWKDVFFAKVSLNIPCFECGSTKNPTKKLPHQRCFYPIESQISYCTQMLHWTGIFTYIWPKFMVFIEVNIPVPFVSIMGYWSFHVFVQFHEPLEGRFPRKLQHTPASDTPLFDYERYPGFFCPLVKFFWFCLGVFRRCVETILQGLRPVVGTSIDFHVAPGGLSVHEELRPYVCFSLARWTLRMTLGRRAHSRDTPTEIVCLNPYEPWASEAVPCHPAGLSMAFAYGTSTTQANPKASCWSTRTRSIWKGWMDATVYWSPSCCGDEFGHQGPRSLLWLERAWESRGKMANICSIVINAPMFSEPNLTTSSPLHPTWWSPREVITPGPEKWRFFTLLITSYNW